MTGGRAVLKLFLDESVPDSVGRAFQDAGHRVGYLNRSFARGSNDFLVCAMADSDDAILVALDGDMKRIARGHGAGKTTYLKIGLIKLSCREPAAAGRVASAMSLIEHEWLFGAANKNRRLFVEIGDLAIRTYR